MLTLGSLAPDISIQTDCGWFNLTEQIGKKVVVFFFHVLTHPAVLKKPYNSLHYMMLLPRKKL